MKLAPKIISLLLAIIVTFSLIACEGETTTEYIKNDLVASAKNSDLSSGVLSLNMEGTEFGYDATIKLSGNQKFDSDLYFMTYHVNENISEQEKKAAAVYLRDGNIYTVFVGGEKTFSLIPISTSNYELEINNHLLNTTDTIGLLYSKTEFYGAITEFLNNLFPVSDSFIERLATLPDNLMGLLKNAYALGSGDATEVYNGYRLSVDVVSTIKKCLLKFVEIGKAIDKDPSITVEGLYNSTEFNDLFMPILVDTDATTARSLLAAINDYLAKENSEISFDILEAIDSENAYDYLKRFINTKVKGLTIASLRIKDLADMFGDSNASMEQRFSEIRTTVLDAVKQFTDALKIVYFFDTDKALTRISIDFNLKKDSFIASVLAYENTHVKIDYRPQEVEEDLKIIPNLA